MPPSCTFHPTFEVQRKTRRNQNRASFVDGHGRNHRWRWNAIPVSLRNQLWNTLCRYRCRVMTASDEGLDACTDDPAIQQLVVAAQRYCLEIMCLILSNTQKRPRG